MRPGHPLLARNSLRLAELARRGWIVPPAGSVLRHRVELMFQERRDWWPRQSDRDHHPAVHDQDTRTYRLLAPAAQVMLRAIKAMAHEAHGTPPAPDA